MQLASENITINELRAKAADRPYRLARLGARPLPHRLLPPPPPKKIEIIDRGSVDTTVKVVKCRNQVVYVILDYAEEDAHIFIGPRDQRLEISNIRRVVAKYFGISILDLVSDRRTVDFVRPRQIAMYLAKKLTSLSYPKIGHHIGKRDHTTVIHAVQKYERLIETDPDIAKTIETLTIKLKGRAS